MTKRPPKGYMEQKVHNSYGIQKWLLSKGFCLENPSDKYIQMKAYKEVLTLFCVNNGKDFPNLKTKESYIQENFTAFCQFCISHFK